jgi:hypothetical protein
MSLGATARSRVEDRARVGLRGEGEGWSVQSSPKISTAPVHNTLTRGEKGVNQLWWWKMAHTGLGFGVGLGVRARARARVSG